MVENQLAAMSGECCQVGGHRVHQRLDIRQCFLFHIDFHCGGGWSENAWPRRENPTDGATGCNPRVVQETGVNRKASSGLRAAHSFLDRFDFLPAEARIAFPFLARQQREIKIAAQRIRNHTVGHAVEGIALLQQRIDDQLAVRVADGLRDDWLAVCILGSDLIEPDRGSTGRSPGSKGRRAWQDRLR